MKLEFSQQFLEKKNNQISNLMKICPDRAEFFHANRRTDGRAEKRVDGRTDGDDEANSRLSQFCERA